MLLLFFLYSVVESNSFCSKILSHSCKLPNSHFFFPVVKGFSQHYFLCINGSSHTLPVPSVSFPDPLTKGDLLKFFVSFSTEVECAALAIELAFCHGQVVIKCAGNREMMHYVVL